jgi:hypothetical protein
MSATSLLKRVNASGLNPMNEASGRWLVALDAALVYASRPRGFMVARGMRVALAGLQSNDRSSSSQ